MQRGIRGEAEDEIDAIGGTPVEHLRGGVVAVAAQQNLDPWPDRANRSD